MAVHFPSNRSYPTSADEPVWRCPCCGSRSPAETEPVLKRGAVLVAFDPVAVWWRGKPVALSPVEALVFARLAQRGRMVTFEIDEYMQTVGAKPATRSLVLGHIRRKFQLVGACDPIERLSTSMIRLRVDPDEQGSTGPIIGLRQLRYARAGQQ